MVSQIQDNFRFSPTTALQALWIVDCYLTKFTVSKKRLLEIALASIRIASKWGEVNPVTMKEALMLSQKKWQPREIISVEREILQWLDWKLGAPNVYENALELVDYLGSPQHVVVVLQDIAKVAGADYSLLGYRVSVVSLVCVSVACEIASFSFPWRQVESIMCQVGMECTDEAFDECFRIVEKICATHGIQSAARLRSTSPTSVDAMVGMKLEMKFKKRRLGPEQSCCKRLKMK